MENLTKAQKIELYDLIYPKSNETDNDIKANDMAVHLKDEDWLVIPFSGLKKISEWMHKNGLWA